MSEASSEPVTDAKKYNQTQAQLEAIEDEIKATQVLTSELLDLSTLKKDYPSSENSSKYFLLGIEALFKKYTKLRKTRGDGNCYYRSFLYSLSEKLLNNPGEKERVLRYGTLLRGKTRWLLCGCVPRSQDFFLHSYSQGVQPAGHVSRRIRGNGY